MAEEKKSSPSIKVTDKRLFTSEGDIREEYRETVTPRDPAAPAPEPPPPKTDRKEKPQAPPEANPQSESLFMSLIELLVYQASVALSSQHGELTPQQVEGARQLIDIVDMLAEKTAGNLSPAEHEFLESRRGALKLAYVQRTKRI